MIIYFDNGPSDEYLVSYVDDPFIIRTVNLCEHSTIHSYKGFGKTGKGIFIPRQVQVI